MKKSLFLIMLLPFFAISQESERFVNKGLISMKGTLGLGAPMAYSGTNMYISGNIEYYLEQNISFRGGIWLFLGTTGDNDVLSKNSTLFTGFYYHIKTNNHLDPYIDFEPGLSWTQMQESVNSLMVLPAPGSVSKYPQGLSPVASFGLGVNYYATQSVHLFIEAKYVQGIHVSDIPAVSLNEFRIAFGFGFNMWTGKKKKS